MNMEEFTGGEFSGDYSVVITKRKRSKRQRLSSPICAGASGNAAITSSYSNDGSGSNCNSIDLYSPSTSTDLFEITTEEDEELVECLMLLAKGICPMNEMRKIGQRSTDMVTSRKFDKMSADTYTVAAAQKDGYIVHECKICNRTFPSGQALGGHQSSHKKLKSLPEETTERSLVLLPRFVNEEGEEAQIDMNFVLAPQPLQMIAGKDKAKLHECSLCGAEFFSGQALGGHMGKHRTTSIILPPAMNPSTCSLPSSSQIITNIHSTEDVVENPCKGISLDLNFPAPEDVHGESNCELASTSTSTWLNC